MGKQAGKSSHESKSKKKGRKDDAGGVGAIAWTVLAAAVIIVAFACSQAFPSLSTQEAQRKKPIAEQKKRRSDDDDGQEPEVPMRRDKKSTTHAHESRDSDAQPKSKFGFSVGDSVIPIGSEDYEVGVVIGFLDDRVAVKFGDEQYASAILPSELTKQRASEPVSKGESQGLRAEPLKKVQSVDVDFDVWSKSGGINDNGWHRDLDARYLSWIRENKLTGCGVRIYDCSLTPGQVKTLAKDLREPFVLRNCHHLSLNLSMAQLEEEHGELPLGIYNVDPLSIHQNWKSKRSVNVQQFMQELSQTKDSAFDASEDSPLGGALMKTFNQKHRQQPLHAFTNLFQQRPVLSLVPDGGKDVPFHWHYPGFLFLQQGLKLWFMYPPFGKKPLPSQLAWHGPASWISDGYWSQVPPERRPKTCLQQAGDLFYVPDGYWHATLPVALNFGYGYQGNSPVTMQNLPHKIINLRDSDPNEHPLRVMTKELQYYEWLRDNIQPYDFNNRILIADMKLALGMGGEDSKRQQRLQSAGQEYLDALGMVIEGMEEKRLAGEEAISLLEFAKETSLELKGFKASKLKYMKNSNIIEDIAKAIDMIRGEMAKSKRGK